MFKIIFYRGLTSGIIAAMAAIIFKHIHQFATYTDFSKVVSVPVLIAVNVGVCMLAAVLFFALVKWLGKRGEIVFNIFFFIASFGSVMWSFAYILPLEIEAPELFPGLTVPMHFFPALAWFALAPIFKNEV